MSDRKPGVQMPHAERKRRTGRVHVQCYLDADIAAKLDRLAGKGTRTAVITKLIDRAREA